MHWWDCSAPLPCLAQNAPGLGTDPNAPSSVLAAGARPFPRAQLPATVFSPMNISTCSNNLEQVGDAPSLAVLGLAATVLAVVASVTLSKWLRFNASRMARVAPRGTGAASVGVSVVRSEMSKKAAAKKLPEYRIEDVRKHDSPDDAWVVIGDGVYNVTKWAPRHPGGERNILDISGRCVRTS